MGLAKGVIGLPLRPKLTKGVDLPMGGQRLTHRRGKKRAVVAVAHTILVIAYHVVQRQQPYQDLGRTYFDERERSAVARQSVRRLEQLGFKVTLETAGVGKQGRLCHRVWTPSITSSSGYARQAYSYPGTTASLVAKWSTWGRSYVLHQKVGRSTLIRASVVGTDSYDGGSPALLMKNTVCLLK